MTEWRVRALLSAYGLAGSLAYPLVGPYVSWRARKGKEDRARSGERSGIASKPRPAGPIIWAHAASVGETNALISLLQHLLDLGLNIVLTTGTVTSARIAEDVFGDRVIHQYVPLDLKPAVRRFLDYWEPDLAIVAESEIWPTTITELAARRTPQILVNGRLSERSFKSWGKRAGLAASLFESFALVVAQSALDGERFSTLGARRVIISGNLKVDVSPPAVDEAALVQLGRQIGRRPRWAATSTHDGEERLAGEVHLMVRERHRGLLSIIVPRHPQRADAVAAELAGMGLRVVRRTSGAPITPDTDVFLGDTIGEMGLYLRLTEIAFVGRSLTAEGGQNPLEPAMLGTAVLAGRNVHNFRDAYQTLIDAGGARLVRDKDMLAGAVNYLLSHDKTRRDMIVAGVQAVENMRGALDLTMNALEPFVHPLVVKSRLVIRGDA